MPIVPVAYDQASHPVPVPGAAMTAAASGSVAGTIIPVAAGAGAGSATSLTTGQNATDAAGVFTVTAAGTPAAGVVATINLLNPFPAQELPAYFCNVIDTTASPNTVVAAAVLPVVASGQVSTLNVISAVLTAAHVYEVEYGTIGA
jgi:hypothetical protein